MFNECLYSRVKFLVISGKWAMIGIYSKNILNVMQATDKLCAEYQFINVNFRPLTANVWNGHHLDR